MNRFPIKIKQIFDFEAMKLLFFSFRHPLIIIIVSDYLLSVIISDKTFGL